MAEEAGPPHGVARLHVLARPSPIGEAARFIASALLVSHGIRRDTMAVVLLESGEWIVVRGWEARHLRPDIDSAIGYVRAVLRGARLGGEVVEEPPGSVGVCRAVGGEGEFLHRVLPLNPPATFYYGVGSVEGCRGAWAPGWLAPGFAPALVNALLDMVWMWKV